MIEEEGLIEEGKTRLLEDREGWFERERQD